MKVWEVWMFGSLDVWKFGRLGVWMFGSLGVWMLVGLAPRASRIDGRTMVGLAPRASRIGGRTIDEPEDKRRRTEDRGAGRSHDNRRTLFNHLLVCLIILGACGAAKADFIDNFLEVEPGSVPHLVSNEIRMPAVINFAVETNGTSGIRVVAHHENACGYVEVARQNAVLDDAYFSRDAVEVSSSSNVIAVAFSWWYPSASSSAYRRYGWFVVERRQTEIAVLGCRMTDTEGDLTIPNDIPTTPEDPHDSEAEKWKWTRIGDCVRLDANCIPKSTQDAVVVPATINGLPVAEIGDAAFHSCRQVTSVSLPATVRSIGIAAFEDCLSLTSCDIPAAVTNIGALAFYKCIALQGVTLPQGLRALGERAFAHCETITSLVCSCSLSGIDRSSFSDCVSLVSVALPETLVSIGESAFAGCCALTNCILPATVADIGDRAFDECPLPSVAVPCGAKIGNTAFADDCVVTYRYPWSYATEPNVASNALPETVSNLDSRVFSGNAKIMTLLVPDSVTNIENAACSALPDLRELVVGRGLVSCESDAFASCPRLTNVVIRDGCRVVGERMFADCPSLSRVSIPPSVRQIGAGAFDGCSALKSVIVPANVAVADGAFPKGCEVARVGPQLFVAGTDRWDETSEEGARLLRLVDTTQWTKARRINVRLDGSECGYDDIKLLSFLGVSTSRYSFDRDGTLDAYFATPEVRVSALQPSEGRMVVQVVPAAGATIVGKPDVGLAVVRTGESLQDLVSGNATECRDGSGIAVDATDYERQGLLRIDLSDATDGKGTRFFHFSFTP